MNIYNYDSNFNIIKEIEYNEKNADFIDDRIWKVCRDAENNYDKNQRTVKEIERLKKFDFKLKDYNKKKQIDDEIKIKNEFKSYQNDQLKELNEYNKIQNLKKVEEDSSYLDLDDRKELFKSNGMNKISNKQENKSGISKLEHKHKKLKKCVACELKKKYID
jgi:hypothetical protein